MIRIANSGKFKRHLEALALDVGNANIHWRLRRDLLAAFPEHPLVHQQTPTFWYLTLEAHASVALQCLARAYDQNPKALHLLGWLNTISENLHLFETSEFKQRLAGNAFVDSLAEHPRVPDRNQLSEDIAACSATDPKVQALIQYRNNIGSHRNARIIVAGRSLSKEFALLVADIEVLMDRAHHIVNRYSDLFAAATYSRQIVGHDDYRFLLTCVEKEIERSRSGLGG
jgi:hypothetical protein